MRKRGLREKRGGALVYERKEWENGLGEASCVKWWDAPLSGYQRDSWVEGGEPRMDGLSLSLNGGANCEWLAEKEDEGFLSYLCQHSNV